LHVPECLLTISESKGAGLACVDILCVVKILVALG